MKKVTFMASLFITLASNPSIASEFKYNEYAFDQKPTHQLRLGGSSGGGSGGTSQYDNPWSEPSMIVSPEEFSQALLDAGLNNPIVIDDQILTPALIDLIRKRMLLMDSKGKNLVLKENIFEGCLQSPDSEC